MAHYDDTEGRGSHARRSGGSAAKRSGEVRNTNHSFCFVVDGGVAGCATKGVEEIPIFSPQRASVCFLQNLLSQRKCFIEKLVNSKSLRDQFLSHLVLFKNPFFEY